VGCVCVLVRLRLAWLWLSLCPSHCPLLIVLFSLSFFSLSFFTSSITVQVSSKNQYLNDLLLTEQFIFFKRPDIRLLDLPDIRQAGYPANSVSGTSLSISINESMNVLKCLLCYDRGVSGTIVGSPPSLARLPFVHCKPCCPIQRIL